jgi:hypothetical protein
MTAMWGQLALLNYGESRHHDEEWKIKHPEAHSELKKKADEPTYYKCFPDEHVIVPVNGCDVEFKGTIRALSGAPLGVCQNLAKTAGPHPYICIACNALLYGKSSPLNRRLSRNKTLKNPRSDDKDRS